VAAGQDVEETLAQPLDKAAKDRDKVEAAMRERHRRRQAGALRPRRKRA